MYRKGNRGLVLRLVILLFLLLVLLFSVFQIVRHLKPAPKKEVVLHDPKTVVYEGEEYYPRYDIETLLVMGIDKDGPVCDSGSYNNDGEADALILLVIDHTQECIHMLNLNRDTMAQIPVLGLGGERAGTIYGQLALSHTYGSGLEDSCENTVTAVSDLLGGVRIDHYLAMNMDAVAAANDAIGGVPVTVTEDFSRTGSGIPMGETTLYGQQALDYIRYRKGVGDELNVSRMERQSQYVDSFVRTLKTAMENGTVSGMTLYAKTADYIVTDCTANTLATMLDRYGEYELKQIESLPGENKKGGVYMEFYPDQAAVERLVMGLFYEPK